MYGTGIGSLDDLGGELEKNSRSTFENLNSQVKSHSESLETVSNSLFITEIYEVLCSNRKSIFP